MQASGTTSDSSGWLPQCAPTSASGVKGNSPDELHQHLQPRPAATARSTKNLGVQGVIKRGNYKETPSIQDLIHAPEIVWDLNLRLKDLFRNGTTIT